jgi:hypothetical protein
MIYNRLFQYVEQIRNYDYAANFDNGHLTGEFQDASGKPVKLPEFRIG